MKTIEELKRHQANHRNADNFKMITVGILMLSLVIFTAVGKDNVKLIIWYWATGMVFLLFVNLVLDVIASRKDKEIRNHE